MEKQRLTVSITVTLRFVSRTIHLGSMKKLQMEDALMGFVGVDYSLLVDAADVNRIV